MARSGVPLRARTAVAVRARARPSPWNVGYATGGVAPRRQVARFVRAGDVVADLGCRRGYHTLALAEQVGPTGQVYAVDIDAPAVAELRRSAAARGLRNIEAHVTTAADVRFIPDGSVDFVLASGLLCSMADRRQEAVEEIVRILAPEGRALISLGFVRPLGLVNRDEWRRILDHFTVHDRGGLLAKWALVSRKAPGTPAAPAESGQVSGRRGIIPWFEDLGAKPSGLAGRGSAWAMSILFRPLYRRIARHLDLHAEDAVLDVACGSGAFLDVYASHVRRIAGIDHSDVAIAMARRRLRDRIADGSAEIIEGDATTLPWPDDTFTAVTCNCLGCFAEPRRALAETFRVLRPDGRAVFTFDVAPEHRKPQADRRFEVWDASEIRTMVGDAGFSQVTVVREGNSMVARAVKRRGPGDTPSA